MHGKLLNYSVIVHKFISGINMYNLTKDKMGLNYKSCLWVYLSK